MTPSEYLKSEQFKEDFRKQVEKDTWDNGLPMVYLNEQGDIVKHYKDGTVEKINNMKETKFKVGDKAYKTKGYHFPCTIVSVFETTSGNVRVVAEMNEYGLLHIFNEDQLEKIPKKTSLEKLELLNSEGAILTLCSLKDEQHIQLRHFWVIDQFGKNVLSMRHPIIEFIKGERPIIDSREKEWWYNEHSEDMKPSTIQQIEEFLNIESQNKQ